MRRVLDDAPSTGLGYAQQSGRVRRVLDDAPSTGLGYAQQSGRVACCKVDLDTAKPPREVMKSWGWTFQFHGGFRCCLVARKRRNRPGARFASRGAAEVPSLAASAPGEVKSRGNHQLCGPEPPTGATDEREPDDRRVAIRHRHASPSAAPFGSDFLGSVYLTLLTEAKIQFKPVEPRNARVDLLGP